MECEHVIWYLVRLAGAILSLQNLLCVYISGDCGVALQLIASLGDYKLQNAVERFCWE
jgi:hypothetical protein